MCILKHFLILVLLLVSHFLAYSGTAQAEVFYAQDEALKLAFPDADKVEKETFLLTEIQKARVEELAKAKLESSIVAFYKGFQAGKLLGYAAIGSHIVRSMRETYMVVLDIDGRQKKVVILAFNEPPEYMASPRWLAQFEGKTLQDDLWPGRGIHGIVGSTLTTNAITAGVRQYLALYKVLIAKEE